VELGTHRAVEAHVERSDVCACPRRVSSPGRVAFACAAALGASAAEPGELVAAVSLPRTRRTLWATWCDAVPAAEPRSTRRGVAGVAVIGFIGAGKSAGALLARA
jgi:hypothetical protein